MTPFFQTANFNTLYGNSRKPLHSDLYSVTVEGDDGDSIDFEVQATSSAEVQSIAVQKAADMGLYNVINVFIYRI